MSTLKPCVTIFSLFIYTSIFQCWDKMYYKKTWCKVIQCILQTWKLCHMIALPQLRQKWIMLAKKIYMHQVRNMFFHSFYERNVCILPTRKTNMSNNQIRRWNTIVNHCLLMNADSQFIFCLCLFHIIQLFFFPTGRRNIKMYILYGVLVLYVFILTLAVGIKSMLLAFFFHTQICWCQI